jgi:phosphatidylserine decarboxylase
MMTLRSTIDRIIRQEHLNFLLTNRIPRRLATRFFGWFSKIENPLVRDLSIGVWRRCSDLDLSDARQRRFRSLHDCFIRELRDGARPIDADPALLVSPCDAIVGAHGTVTDGQVMQIKGSGYPLKELLADDARADEYRDGSFVTLRLTATMYHHFHAPYDCRVEATTYIPGDAWNVNPSALRRVERLFCKNERAVIGLRLTPSGHPPSGHPLSGHRVTLVPVAAILVASLRLRYLDPVVDLRRGGTRTLDLRRAGARTIASDIPLAKGEAMGWFQHGSTIIVFAPNGFRLCDTLREGGVIRVGQPLMRLPETPP